MGWHQHGFHCGSAQHLSSSWFDLGYCGPTDESGTFSPVHTTDKAQKYAELYIDRIVCLHGLPRTIVSDRGAQIVARFWEQLQESLGTKLIRSSAYHPQTDGQTERVNQILEDMLRACAIDCGKNWDKHLSLAEFAYNNSYQSNLKMAPFKALYIWEKV
jgi:transposase InsO family protein